MQTKFEVPAYIKITVIAVGIVACCYILIVCGDILVPLLYASLFAILLNPVITFLVAHRMNRTLAIAISMLLGLLLIAGVIYLLIMQMQTMSATFPKFKDEFFVFLQDGIDWIARKLNLSQQQTNVWLNKLRSQMMDNSSLYITQTFSKVTVILATIVIVPVYIFMLLYYQPLIIEFMRTFFAKDNHASVVDIITSIRTVVQGYLRGLMIELVIVAILNAIALLIIGVEYAILLGVLGAILNLIPYLGGIIAVTLPMVVALVNQDPLHMFLVLGAYALIQFTDNNFLIPKVVASKVEVNGLISIIGVLIGGMLWGIAGMFLSIPLLAVMKVVCDHIDYLKPWGNLLGDAMPSPYLVDSFLKKGKGKK